MSPRRGSWSWALLVALLALPLCLAPASASAASLGATVQLRADRYRRSLPAGMPRNTGGSTLKFTAFHPM